MEVYDYIVVGAGSAGCVLAERLSASGRHRVLLIESGPIDRDPFIHMPKGIPKILANPKLTWAYRTQRPVAEGARPEVWLRGKTLGGSSSVNGMIYVRGQPQDYDGFEALGNRGWGWETMSRYFRRLEDHALGDDGVRGAGGPLHVSPHPGGNALCDALIDAGRSVGLEARRDVNRPDQEGIGYVSLTIKHGRRMSAAKAFLKPAKHRANLRVVTDTTIDAILFEGRRAIGVRGRSNGQSVQYRATREVVLCAGALQTPKLLQLSGIGPAALLQEHGIPVLHDNPSVGANMREHFLLALQYRVKKPGCSYNREFDGFNLVRNVLRYYLAHNGVMATGSHEICAFIKTRPGLDRPDAQLMLTPTSRDFSTNRIAFERQPGAQLFGYLLRPESQGSVYIASCDPDAALAIAPNYLSAPADRTSAVAMVRAMRRLLDQPALRDFLGEETRPTRAVQSDEDILAAFGKLGQSGFHAAGTCRMGVDDGAVVDPQLRVKGVDGLRIMDCSILPTLISGNTNGPMMAMAWRAADLILESEGSP